MTPHLTPLDATDMALVHTEAGCELVLTERSPEPPDLPYIFRRQFGRTVGLASRSSTRPSYNRRTLDIHTASDRFDVGGSDAGAVAAEVIGLKAGRDWPKQRLIGEAVGGNHAVAAIRLAADMECPIAVTLGTCPQPAGTEVGAVSGDGADSHLRPEARRESSVAEGGGGKIGLHRKATPFGVAQPEVFGLAAASIISDSIGTRYLLGIGAGSALAGVILALVSGMK